MILKHLQRQKLIWDILVFCRIIKKFGIYNVEDAKGYGRKFGVVLVNFIGRKFKNI
jgi:hypothetical protein